MRPELSHELVVDIQGEDAEKDEKAVQAYLEEFTQHMRGLFISAIDSIAQRLVSHAVTRRDAT